MFGGLAHISMVSAVPKGDSMSIKRRLPILCAAATAATAALLVGSPAAVAAPTVPGGTLTVTCPGMAPFEIVTTPSSDAADFPPAFTAATHAVFVPYQLSGTIVSSEGTFTFNDVKKAPLPADAITCTFEGTFGEGEFMVTITGTAVVVQRGAPE
jgi:hypothetical protein